MKFVEIEHGSSLYVAELELRNQLLRIPLGLDIYDDDPSGEADCRHFGILSGDRLVGCLVAVPLETGDVQLRQIAVLEELHGQGIGRFMMLKVEGILREAGINRLVLNSRTTVEDFYLKLGYEPVGKVFVEVGIPHQRMEKRMGPMG
jgi:predicted GNAT family N-acyltransferase